MITRIDINIDIDGSLTFVEIENKIITKINFFIIKLLSEGKKINGLEVGYKTRSIVEDSSYFLVSPLSTTSNFIGTFYRHVDTFYNDKILEIEEYEYHFILNYDDQNELYVCVNRDIQKEREKVIDEVLNN